MAFWLARERDGQQSDYIQRFDPRFWTIDFPRPMMGSVVSTGHNSLRVDLEFHHTNELAGLIWDSTDKFDHPLLSYDTDRDYSRTILSFRWRSNGVIALDQPHGPTLTIEGTDSNGAARSWYVRLWNYAKGDPQNAVITLPFSELKGGWDADSPATVLNPRAIEKMFISIAPPGHDPSREELLPQTSVGWVEITDIECWGDRPMLPIGDILLPPHGVMMATAYDDSYNLTPSRILRGLRGLGYRDAITHYVGMSHYYRLTRTSGGDLQAGSPDILNTPTEAWHRNFFTECKKLGYKPIISLSYELLAEHCPTRWRQHFADGSPALTGWVPPSSLLSPANPEAMNFLQEVASRFVRLALASHIPIAFQIGEPWWWTLPDGRIALYDEAARIAFGGAPPIISDLRTTLSDEQIALLDMAGDILAASTGALRDRVLQEAGGNAETMLLLFTPTFLDANMPEVRRANLPKGWAWPAYQRLQLEDYDWLTEGNQGDRYRAYDAVQQHLGYPLERQDYLAGFVLDAKDADVKWRHIDVGIDEASGRGVDRCFVWALPQVNRDGYTRLPTPEDDQMQAFDDVLYPLALGRDSGVSAEFSTTVSLTASGYERRASHWTDARLHFDVGPGLRSEQELGTLISFFRARRGAARGFRLRDPFDFSSRGMTGQPTAFDQLLGVGDGRTARFRLCKNYAGPEPQVRLITRPREDSILASVAGELTDEWTLEPGGWIIFRVSPPEGAEIRAGFYFDVPVRFASDRLEVTGAVFAAGEAPSVPLIEIREAA